MFLRASPAVFIACVVIMSGCGAQNDSAEIEEKFENQDILKLVERNFPQATPIPDTQFGEFSIQVQRRFANLKDRKLYCEIGMVDIVERNQIVFLEGLDFRSRHLHLRLQDAKGILSNLIDNESQFKRFGRYIVVFRMTGTVAPRIYLQSEVKGPLFSEDTQTEITVETEHFPIICGELLWIENIDGDGDAKTLLED